MPNLLALDTAVDRMLFDADTGRLVSLRPHALPDEELLAAAPDHPAFVLQFLDENRQYRQLLSDRSDRSVRSQESKAGQVLTLNFERIGGLDLGLTATVRACRDEPLSRWSLALRNGAGLEVVDVQFPFVVAALPPAGEASDAPCRESAVLLPHFHGALVRNPGPGSLPEDAPAVWQFRPENGDTFHYPGSIFAQFLACYHDRAGLYLACEDTEGNVKLLKATHRAPGIRLGVAHVGDWPRDGERSLEYDVVLGSFTGDWYAAAGRYRSWSLGQKWATPLHRRSDVPEWLLDSPPHITLRLQGVVDDGPVFPVEEFIPYEKAIPLLDGIAQELDAPLVPVIMSWERGGPWVYPDCFPPVGGEESLRRFAAMARARGWHVGSFCNGTRWVLGHAWNGYDGREFFEAHDGAGGACRTPAGDLWRESWDASWRPSYACCMDAEQTRRIATDFVRRLVGWGLESIQFFDQNVSASTFPCFAAEHGHPPLPGKWMARSMERMVAGFREVARRAGESGVIQSTENPCNEFCLPLFQQSDVRGTPPAGEGIPFVPLYHFLFHECIVMHGMMSIGFEPYALPMRVAHDGVLGQIPGAVLTGDGTLLNRHTYNWAPWEPKVGSNAHALAMLRRVTALRRGAGRDFLVFGRMLPPAPVEKIQVMEWEREGRAYAVPAVFHATWQAPDGRVALVLANWTDQPMAVRVCDPRIGDEVIAHCPGSASGARRLALPGGVDLPPLSATALVGAGTGG